MGRAEKNIPERSNHDKIKIRVMELFETVDDLKKLFTSILPENSEVSIEAIFDLIFVSIRPSLSFTPIPDVEGLIKYKSVR